MHRHFGIDGTKGESCVDPPSGRKLRANSLLETIGLRTSDGTNRPSMHPKKKQGA